MIPELARESREASLDLRNYSAQDRSRVLRALSQRLLSQSEEIKQQNQRDIDAAATSGL